MQTQPYAYSYKPIDGTNYNILEGKIRLFEDPLEKGNYPLFANCTIIEPLKEKKNYAVSFNIKENKWEYIENHIGTEGYIDDVPYIVDQYGPLPKKFSTKLSKTGALAIRKDEVNSIIKSILSSTDFLLMPDYDLDSESKEKIIEFRQIVRNLDKDKNYPFYNKSIPIPEWPLKGIKSCPYYEFLSLIKNTVK